MHFVHRTAPTPSHGGAECLYNGSHAGYECGCDECDHLQTCTEQDGRQVLHEADTIELPTEEQHRDFWQHEHELTTWMQSLTPEQIDKLCNAGYYNNAIKGYLLAAAKESGLNAEQQQELLNNLRYCLDTLTKAEADQLYTTYCVQYKDNI